MFYIVETNYVGPNQDQDQYVGADTIEIRITPATTNSSREVCTDGWCGTTNDWAVYAHGEYATIEEARAAIAEKFGDVRDTDPNGDNFDSLGDDGVEEVYKPGKYAPMSRSETADWAYEGIQLDIEADTTDERIAELVAEYEEQANSEGYTLDGDLRGLMEAHRQELEDAAQE